MKIIIDDILKSKDKTRYWLSHITGYAYPNLCKLWNNETESVRFDNLEKICIALECTLDDIILIDHR